MTCLVCDRHISLSDLPGGFIHRDNHIFVAHFPVSAAEPAHFGHIIIEMKRHLTKLSEMAPGEAAAVGTWIQKISLAQESILGAEHIYLTRIGDLTPHLHFHLVPRFKDTPREFWGPTLNKWSGSKKATAEEMIEISVSFRQFLQK